jgi:hypothetical protein
LDNSRQNKSEPCYFAGQKPTQTVQIGLKIAEIEILEHDLTSMSPVLSWSNTALLTVSKSSFAMASGVGSMKRASPLNMDFMSVCAVALSKDCRIEQFIDRGQYGFEPLL